MNTVLQLNTSINSDAGESSQLAARLVAAWRAGNARGKVVVRDLARDPVPHLTAERFHAFLFRTGEAHGEQQAVVAYSDRLIDELEAADTLVIGLPLYNFGVPSMLKAYFDHIARAGVTFRYTAKGAVGLLTGKKAYVVAARGGVYAGTAMDTQTSYVRNLLAFLGITDVEVVYAEGLAMGEESKAAALARAKIEIERIMPVDLPVAA